jgi:hypothetical protein
MAQFQYVFIPPLDLDDTSPGRIIPVKIKKTLLKEETNEVVITFSLIEPDDDEPGDDEEW